MKPYSKLLLCALCVLLLLAIAADVQAAGKYSHFPNGEKPSGLMLVLSLFFGFIATLAVHELGHVFMGLATGFRFELFVVFLLGVKRTEHGVKPYLNTNAGYMGGVAATIPTTPGPDNRRKFAWMILAGPLASLLFSLLCLLALLYTSNVLYTFFFVCCPMSFAIFLATTLPKKTGMFFTDRARYQRLMGNGPAARSEESLLNIIAQTTADNSCANVSLSDTDTLKQDTDAITRFWGYYYEYEYFKTNNLTEKAEDVRAEMLTFKSVLPGALWKALKLS